MRRTNKFVLTFVSILAVAAIVSPFLIGIAIKRSFNQFVAFYNSQNDVKIEVKEYKRGWFYSNAILKVSVKRPELHKLSTILSDKGDQFPEAFTMTVQEHISHGPFLIRRDPAHFISFHLAFMTSHVHLSPELAKFVRPVDLKQPVLQMNSLMTFNHVLLQEVKVLPLVITFPDGESTIQFDGLTSNSFIKAAQKKVMGNFKVNKIKLASHGFILEIPIILSTYNNTALANGFSGGNNSYAVPEISIQDASGKSLIFVDINWKGSLKDASELLYGMKEFSVKNIQMNNQSIGSLNFKLSMSGLSSQGVARLISTYEDLLKDDQAVRYAAFKQQILVGLPKMIHPGSDIEVTEFKIKTPDGFLEFSGSLQWPENLRALPQNLAEVIQLTQAKSNMRVSVPLAKELIELGVDLFSLRYSGPVFASGSPEQLKAINDEKQQNLLAIAVLMQNNQVSRDAVKTLQRLQNDDATDANYTDALDDLLKNKSITDNAAKILKSHYRDVLYMSYTPAERMEMMQKDFMRKVDGWIQAGYLKQDKDFYTMCMSYKDNVFVMNDKKIIFDE